MGGRGDSVGDALAIREGLGHGEGFAVGVLVGVAPRVGMGVGEALGVGVGVAATLRANPSKGSECLYPPDTAEWAAWREFSHKWHEANRKQANVP